MDRSANVSVPEKFTDWTLRYVVKMSRLQIFTLLMSNLSKTLTSLMTPIENDKELMV
jgi:hypothetical protein